MRYLLALALATLAAAVPATACALDAEHAVIVLGTGSDAAARVAAVHVLGATGDAAFEPVLASALANDPDEDVRAACAAGLARLHGPGALAALVRARADASQVVRAAVRAAFVTLAPRPAPAVYCGPVFSLVFHPDYDLQLCSDGSSHRRMHARAVSATRGR